MKTPQTITLLLNAGGSVIVDARLTTPQSATIYANAAKASGAIVTFRNADAYDPQTLQILANAARANVVLDLTN